MIMNIEYQVTFKWKIDDTIIKHEQYNAKTPEGALLRIREKLAYYWNSLPDEIIVAKFVANRLQSFKSWHWTEEGYCN